MNENVEDLDTRRTIRSMKRGHRWIDGIRYESSFWVDEFGKYHIKYETVVTEDRFRMGKAAVKPVKPWWSGLFRFFIWFCFGYGLIKLAQWAF